MHNLRVIYILWLRQVKRYIRNKARIIGSVGQPLLFLVALGFGLGPVFQEAGNVNYIQFLVPGIVGMSILFTATFSGIELISDRQFGFLKETLVAPVSRFSLMLGKALGGATVATLQGFFVLALSFALGFRVVNIWLLLPAMLVGFLIALLFTAMGLVIASPMKDTSAFPLIINFVIFPLFFLSGALYPLDGLPVALALTARVNPLSYGIDALRKLLIGVGHFSLVLDVVVLAVFVFSLLWLGSYFFKKIQV